MHNGVPVFILALLDPGDNRYSQGGWSIKARISRPKGPRAGMEFLGGGS